ncbi:hypothetical protein AAGC94_15335 [Clostridium sporogenes]|uniref:SdpI/YhfL protein family n=1 Tax=Clostridium cochlearium TaxID=1494 RepID=A0A2X2VR19_CLOCO|nr:hypothetical protein [Clostridium cochlearium]MBU5270431.1 hypothetical protein [Clostridium cochlearium]NOH16772.1 hypothetical protein [Clostridium cochlearium]SQB33502.1 SdpI/YhfL protein family [Clostridium cochlearium]
MDLYYSIGLICFMVGIALRFTPMDKNKTMKERNKFLGLMLIIGGIISMILSVIITGLINNKILAAKISGVTSIVIIMICVLLTEIHFKKKLLIKMEL